jgi:IS5 family transposase
MDKNNTKTVFNKYLHPMDEGVLNKIAEQMELDKYVKKLKIISFVKLFTYAQLKQISSLTDISLELNTNPKLQKEIGLSSISKSQLSRKLSDISPNIFQAVLKHLIQKVRQKYGVVKGNKKLRKLYLIDSSTVTLSLKEHPWAPKNRYTSGVKLHTRVVYYDDVTYLDDIIVTPARPADITQLDALIVNIHGTFHVFDRGYFDFKKFERLCSEGIRFATRIKENTVIEVVEEVPVHKNSSILREAVVFLGKMKHPLRLIETVDSEGRQIQIIVNDAKIPSEEVSTIYRDRWKIELFYKWMKQHMVLKTMYGKSQNAVHNQVYLAMIAFCLTLLLQADLMYKGTLLVLKKYLAKFILDRFPDLTKELFKPPSRTSKGRKRYNHEKVFKETLIGVEEGKFME